jgi:hypothetical protein
VTPAPEPDIPQRRTVTALALEFPLESVAVKRTMRRCVPGFLGERSVSRAFETTSSKRAFEPCPEYECWRPYSISLLAADGSR